MNELRKDYILDRWVIIAKERGKRPHEFLKEREKREKRGLCFFCPGNEHTTPPEISRIEEDGKWLIRCFPNKFPATATEVKTFEENLLVRMSAYGRHEVIVETPEHDTCLGDLNVEHIAKIIDMYSERLIENKKDPRIGYVLIFKNKGKEAGTSLEHSHTQLIALRTVPTAVREEVDASKKYIKENGNCPFCDIWKMEMKSERRIFENKYMVAFAPFAPRFSFEAWIMPKRHVTSLEFLNEKERFSFAEILKKLISKLNSSMNYPPYNFYLHVSPKKEDLHFHLELCPRMSKWAGFELGSGLVINTMPPELAAKHYRE
ncbi:MAG TPA: galactose-1-phosphate uridylyltransferase [Candidatus Altiarchaeales archaeon]|nr:galactose-1-phosphate uridylyltransferase [Candidatus Altiarchaeales archaeon]